MLVPVDPHNGWIVKRDRWIRRIEDELEEFSSFWALAAIEKRAVGARQPPAAELSGWRVSQQRVEGIGASLMRHHEAPRHGTSNLAQLGSVHEGIAHHATRHGELFCHFIRVRLGLASIAQV